MTTRQSDESGEMKVARFGFVRVITLPFASLWDRKQLAHPLLVLMFMAEPRHWWNVNSDDELDLYDNIGPRKQL